MSPKKMIVMFICSILAFSLCSKENDQVLKSLSKNKLDELIFSHSMKGWELYSWLNGDTWKYSVIIGTNRLKTYEEVTTNEVIVAGTDSLKMIFNKFPEEEEIFWISSDWLERCWASDYQNLSLPSQVIIDDVKDYCESRNLVLQILN